jgi:hypothetical protein
VRTATFDTPIVLLANEHMQRILPSDQLERRPQLHDAFVAGAQAKGVSATIANAIFDQLRAFGSYAFPKSHAAAFAVIVYQSAWLKCYHPAAFACAILNNAPMGFWPPSVIVKTAEEIRAAVKNNPFMKEKDVDVSELHVTFLSAAPQKAASNKLEGISFPPERFSCGVSEIFLHCPNGVGQSKLPIQLFEKTLGVRATSRNWRTVNKLLEMTSE